MRHLGRCFFFFSFPSAIQGFGKHMMRYWWCSSPRQSRTRPYSACPYVGTPVKSVASSSPWLAWLARLRYWSLSLDPVILSEWSHMQERGPRRDQRFGFPVPAWPCRTHKSFKVVPQESNTTGLYWWIPRLHLCQHNASIWYRLDVNICLRALSLHIQRLRREFAILR